MSNEIGQSLDEVFDVVDAEDRVISSNHRGEIHRLGLRHRAIHIFWRRPDGRICLQRRSFAKDHCPGLLSSSCAGHVDAGETYQGAAVRELREELGVILPASSLHEIDYAPSHPALGNEFVRSYFMEGDFTTTLARAEVDAILWRYPQEIDEWINSAADWFAPPLVHLLARPAIRDKLSLRG
jgi:isopentenyldiphosphate isomerase